MKAPRIAVTGMGALTPFGPGVDRLWQAVLERRSGVGPLRDPALARFAPVAAEIRGFAPADHLPQKVIRDTDRFTHLTLVAVEEALADAQLLAAPGVLDGSTDPDRIGIAWGTAFGGIGTIEQATTRLLQSSAGRVAPRTVSKSIPNAAASAIAMRYGLRGPSMTYTTACAASANAIGEALCWLAGGLVDCVVAGGAESLFTPTVLAGLRAAGAIATEGPDDLTTWCRPFDAERKGMIMGEGAAAVILEPLARAVARGSKIYAILGGYGTSNDAYHETAPHPEGEGAVLAMERALRFAGLTPEQIDYVNAHATSTPAGDQAEALALRRVFGKRLDRLPVSSTKGGLGHLLGAAGAVESILCIKAIETGWLPPTLHCHRPDPDAPPDLLLDGPRKVSVETAMSNSFGFGGQNAVLIWLAPEAFS